MSRSADTVLEDLADVVRRLREDQAFWHQPHHDLTRARALVRREADLLDELAAMRAASPPPEDDPVGPDTSPPGSPFVMMRLPQIPLWLLRREVELHERGEYVGTYFEVSLNVFEPPVDERFDMGETTLTIKFRRPRRYAVEMAAAKVIAIEGLLRSVVEGIESGLTNVEDPAVVRQAERCVRVLSRFYRVEFDRGVVTAVTMGDREAVEGWLRRLQVGGRPDFEAPLDLN